jgi:hypothetical protein
MPRTDSTQRRETQISARDLAYELSLRADTVARRLLGAPNKKHSTKRELRYRNHGSLRVRIAGPKRGKWNDYESGEYGDLLALIQREKRYSFPEACDYARELLDIHEDARSPPAPEDEAKPEDDASRIARALRIWRSAVPIADMPGAVYLARRGIDLAAVPDLNKVLRWHGACPWGEGGATHPCIVALWTNIVSAAPQAIHRRPISSAGEELDRWKALGPAGDCCIRLWPDEYVERGLVLGEGPETVLSAATHIEHRGTLLRPAWAAGDAWHMEVFPVLAGIDALTLLVDNDQLDPKTGKHPGQYAAAACAQRWRAAGREVIPLLPRAVDTDFNDIVMREQPP